jgi:hypothetical protein
MNNIWIYLAFLRFLVRFIVDLVERLFLLGRDLPPNNPVGFGVLFSNARFKSMSSQIVPVTGAGGGTVSILALRESVKEVSPIKLANVSPSL